MTHEKDELNGRVTQKLSTPLTFEQLLSESIEEASARKATARRKTPEERVLHRLENWIPNALVMVFNRQTCACCGESTTTSTSPSPLIRAYNPRNPTELWYYKPIASSPTPDLPRESITNTETVKVCAKCWDAPESGFEIPYDSQEPFVKITIAPDMTEHRPVVSSDPSQAKLEDLWK